MTSALKMGDVKRKGDERNNNSKKCEHAKPLNCALER